jgi:hypothetical protein
MNMNEKSANNESIKDEKKQILGVVTFIYSPLLLIASAGAFISL